MIFKFCMVSKASRTQAYIFNTINFIRTNAKTFERLMNKFSTLKNGVIFAFSAINYCRCAFQNFYVTL